MPSLITHNIFAKEVYSKLPDKIKDTFKKEKLIYQTFAQSHDILFYYKSPNIKKTKIINRLGKIGHRRNTQDYLLNIIKLIKEYHLQLYQPDIAYLYGAITHYILDSTCHPFIFYKTGVYDSTKKIKALKKYKGLHALMERSLDAYYYKKYYKKDYKNCNISKEIIQNPKLSIDLITLINMTYKKTYNFDNAGIYYYKGIKNAKRICSLFINDKHKIKYNLYKFIDKITKNKLGYIHAYSTNVEIHKEYLNLNHQEWNHPCIKEEKHTESIDDLYNIAIDKCLNIFKEVHKVIFDNKDIESLKKVIPNVSYSTNLELDKNKPLKYFEF